MEMSTKRSLAFKIQCDSEADDRKSHQCEPEEEVRDAHKLPSPGITTELEGHQLP